MRDVEGGLLPQRGLVRLVHGTRDRVGGRLAPRLRVGLSFNPRTVRSGVPYSLEISGRLVSDIDPLRIEGKVLSVVNRLSVMFVLGFIRDIDNIGKRFKF